MSNSEIKEKPIGKDDCCGQPIKEYMMLWHRVLCYYEVGKDCGYDPRYYYIVVAADGIPYAIGGHFLADKEIIRKRENIPADKPIPTIVKKLSELKDFCIAKYNGKELYYPGDREKLKKDLNEELGLTAENGNQGEKKQEQSEEQGKQKRKLGTPGNN